jgi:tRNA G18 (ribose-2'-O)-methylase SpoU
MSNIIEIESADDPRVEMFIHLTEPQLRNKLEPEKGLFIAESPKVITRAMNAGIEPIAFLMEEKHAYSDAAEIIERCPDIPCYVGPRGILTDLTGYKLTRGVLGAMRRPKMKSIDEVLCGAKRIGLIEDVNNHTNIGSIFRAAAALNMDALLLSPTCCDPLFRRAARVSMGSVFQIPWTRIGTSTADWPLPSFLQLKEYGFKTAALALEDNSISIDNASLKNEEKLALLFGAEGYGLKPQTIQLCDYVVKIPMGHGVDSLNVAACAAIAFWELGQR